MERKEEKLRWKASLAITGIEQVQKEEVRFWGFMSKRVRVTYKLLHIKNLFKNTHIFMRGTVICHS